MDVDKDGVLALVSRGHMFGVLTNSPLEGYLRRTLTSEDICEEYAVRL